MPMIPSPDPLAETTKFQGKVSEVSSRNLVSPPNTPKKTPSPADDQKDQKAVSV